VVPPWLDPAGGFQPQANPQWNPNTPMQLDYVDPPPGVIIEIKTPARRKTKTSGKAKSRKADS
jgi:hypothetical protein